MEPAGLDFDPGKVFHWGYVVPDIDRALKAWTAMGAIVVVPPTQDPIQKVFCSLLIFKGAVPIELVAPVSKTDNPVKVRLAKGGGLDHVCLFTDDLQADLRSFVDDGACVAVQPTYGEVFDRELAFLVTRVGLVVELMNRRALGRRVEDPLIGFPSRNVIR